MQAGDKRKRDLDCPRITFHAPGRTFDRLFKEDSLKELKAVARKKLGLGLDATINLSQIRGDKHIDLEDEDDFDAFYNALLTSSTVDVRVTIETRSVAVTKTSLKSQETQPSQAPEEKSRKKLNNPPLLPPDSTVKQPSGAKQPLNEDAEPPSKRLKTASTKPSISRPNEAPKEGDTSAMATKEPVEEATRAVDALAVFMSAIRGSGYPRSTRSDAPLVNNATTSEPPEKVSAKPTKAKKATSSGDVPVVHANPTLAEVDKPKAKKRKLEGNPGLGDKKVKKSSATQKQPTEAGTIAAGTSSTPPITVPGPNSEQNSSQPAKTTPSLSRPDESADRKDTKPKTKKSKLATTDSGKPKKKVKSKSKERVATSAVESEITTNDAITEPSLANISRLMIEKYLNPSSAVGSEQSTPVKPTGISQATQSTSLYPAKSKLSSKETCRYCGGVSTHARSDCPIIRAGPDAIQSRIIELKEDFSQDAGGHRTSTIEELELMLRKKPTAAAKRNSNVNSLPSKHPASIGAASEINTGPTASVIMTTSLPPRSLTSPSLNDSGTSPSVVFNEPPPDISSPHPETQSESSQERIPPKNTAQLIQNNDGETGISSESVSATTPQFKPRSLRSAASHLPSYTEKDLEALIRGPGSPLRPTELPSTETSEDEQTGELEPDDELNGKVPLASRQRQHHVTYSESTSEEDRDEEPPTPPIHKLHGELRRTRRRTTNVTTYEEESDSGFTSREGGDRGPPALRTATSPTAQSERALAGVHPVDRSFQQMSDRAGSVEMDKTGNDVFESVFTQETAVLRLVDSEPTPPQNQSTASLGSNVQPDVSTLNQIVDKDTSRGASHPELEPGNVPQETAPVRVFEPDPIEAAETPEIDRRRSPIEGDDGFIPSPHEESMRESTPKPAYVRRMRTRVQLASPPVAKPQSSRFTALRSQQRTKANDQNVDKDQDGPKERGAVALAANRTVSTRSMAAAEEANEEADSPPRRLTRSSFKAFKTATSMNPISSHAIRSPPSKRGRQISKPIATDARDPSRSEAEPKEKAKTKESAGASKPPETTLDQPLTPSTKTTDTSAQNDQTIIQGVTTPPSPPISLDAWATLPLTTPLPDTQSDPMVDELHSDQDSIPFSPGAELQSQRRPPSLRVKQSSSRLEQAMQNAKEKGKGKQKSSLEFILSENHDAFPYSQPHTQAPADSDSPSDSEEEVRDAVMKRSGEAQPSKYRRLTDFASEAVKLFTPRLLRHSTLSTPASEPAKRKDKLRELYGKMGKESGDEDSDSSAGSESEGEKISHIPRSRRAGAPVKGRMPKS